MANRLLTPYRVYKYMLTSDGEDYVVNNYSVNTGWGLYYGIKWTDRNEPEYRLSDIFMYHHTDGNCWTQLTNEIYAQDSQGSPTFIDSYQSTTKLTSGEVIFDNKAVAICLQISPTVYQN